MARRRLTVKRLDPWSVLKFGAVANLVLLAIAMLGLGVVWFIVDRLDLVEQACDIATDIGFSACNVDAGGLFRAVLLLGLLWAVVQTAVLVFLAFLHNLIADLTGGLVIGIVDDTPARTGAPGARSGRDLLGSGPVSDRGPSDQQHPSEGYPRQQRTAGTTPVPGERPPPTTDPTAGQQRRSSGGDELYVER